VQLFALQATERPASPAGRGAQGDHEPDARSGIGITPTAQTAWDQTHAVFFWPLHIITAYPHLAYPHFISSPHIRTLHIHISYHRCISAPCISTFQTNPTTNQTPSQPTNQPTNQPQTKPKPKPKPNPNQTQTQTKPKALHLGRDETFFL
jgi:hypothetical protein